MPQAKGCYALGKFYADCERIGEDIFSKLKIICSVVPQIGGMFDEQRKVPCDFRISYRGTP